MADIMYPIPFGQLMDWILTEFRTQGSIFGVRSLYRRMESPTLALFGRKLEAPYGPAAGPHTQLAQNIIAAFAAGARFFELKTVQILDGEDLRACVSKPCIWAPDECYNCEWSTELTVQQAYDEYVKAWFACKLLSKELRLGDPDGFIFNMSVGYDLAGIQSEKIDRFIENMKDASQTPVWAACRAWALENLHRFRLVDADFICSISPHISNSITESTLHGCPPQEIERIAAYLMTEKQLHTYIKCNPTLLGYDFARAQLDALGFDYIDFDRSHFEHDLQYADAQSMFRRLMVLGKKKGLQFGLKLTNTFPVKGDSQLPSDEMYMSGRSLYPLTLALASRIGEDFEGTLPISFSGGADAQNIKGLLDAGVCPVTMATTLLKPGGYEEFVKIGQAALSATVPEAVDAAALRCLCDAVLQNEHYRKPIKPQPSRKIGKELPLTDCFTSPCRSGCPIGQDIPAYLHAADEGDFERALQIILQRNPLPFITGTICPHHCQDKCMGNHRFSPVQIRNAKLLAAEGGFNAVLPTLKAKDLAADKRVAIIGGGPAGLAAAAFLARAGVPVTIFEQRGALGGIVRHVIPEFRIDSERIDHDTELCLAYGAQVRLNAKVTDFAALWAEGFTDIIVATGAWKPGTSPLEYGDGINVIDFLKQTKAAPETLDLGQNIVIIGGGNTAMDAARAAKRLRKDSCVRLVYRRTRRYMSADEEELRMALEEGVEFLELLSPICARDGELLCRVMVLGAPDASGRRSCIPTEKVKRILADSIIYAVGQQVDTEIFDRCGAAYTQRGPVTDADCRTTAAHIFAIGDARRGPATVVEAIADAAAAARAITGCDFDRYEADNVCPPAGDCRCCAGRCEVCVEVCPNRANIAITVPGSSQRQILHIDGMCNECGNCAVFCPYEGRPYRDKFTLFRSRWDFENSDNSGFLPLGNGKVLVRLGRDVLEQDMERDDDLISKMIRTVMEEYPYLLKFEDGA